MILISSCAFLRSCFVRASSIFVSGGRFDQLAQLVDAIGERLDVLLLAQVWLEPLQGLVEVLHQVGALELRGFLHGEGVERGGGDNLERAQPAPERDQVRDIDIPQHHHVRLDIGLGLGQLGFQFLPRAVRAALEQGFGVLLDPHAGAEGFRLLQDLAADLAQLCDFLRLHHEEAVGDEDAEVEGEDRAVAAADRLVFAFEFVVRERAEVVEILEQLLDRRRRERVDPELLAHVFVTDEIFGDHGETLPLGEGGWGAEDN